MAQRRPHFKCYKKDVEHKEGVGRHRDREKKCPEGGRETEERTGDTTIKSRGDLNRVNMSSEGQGTNRGTARGKRGQNDWAGSQIWTREVF